METTITAKPDVTVKSNDFERLLEKISAERETEKHSELNIQRRLEILKSIASVYFFLRCGLKMPYRAVSLEELEVAEARLKLIAEQEVKKFWTRFWGALGKKTFWHYYTKYGYFKNSVKDIFDDRWCGYGYYYLRENFKEAIRNGGNMTVVSNAEKLIEEIFAKKYDAGKKEVR